MTSVCLRGEDTSVCMVQQVRNSQLDDVSVGGAAARVAGDVADMTQPAAHWTLCSLDLLLVCD